MALNLCGIGSGDGEVGVEDILSVVGGLGGDGVLIAFPLEDVGCRWNRSKVSVYVRFYGLHAVWT